LLNKNEAKRKIRKILKIPLGNFNNIQIKEIIRINKLKYIGILVKVLSYCPNIQNRIRLPIKIIVKT
jgi:hypothetical protein